MAYFAPYIDETGYHYPSYQDIKDYLISNAQRIFGSDIYIDNDSMDGEDISLRALAIYNSFQSAEFAFNNNAPNTSIGAALRSLIKINGISANQTSNSNCQVKIIGAAYTVINNGVVSDVGGNKWDLPASVIIPIAGFIYVDAIAQNQGAITALIGEINKIETPTFGWTSVINETAANVSQPVETDSEIRNRQSLSTANPSQTLLEGTQGALWAVSGVTGVRVEENDTSDSVVVEGLTLPPHSITCVVEGGTEVDIASAIYLRKNEGCYTNGTTSESVIDKYGNTNTVRFYRPSVVSIDVSIVVHPIKNYSSAITAAIKNNIVNHINGLDVSNDVIYSILDSVINDAISNRYDPEFSITTLQIAKHGESLGTSNIALNLNERANAVIGNVTVTPT